MIQPLDSFTVIMIIINLCVAITAIVHEITNYFRRRMIEREKTKRKTSADHQENELMETERLRPQEIRLLPVGSVIGVKSPTVYCVALRVADIGDCWTISGLDKPFNTDYILNVDSFHDGWHMVGMYENEN